MAAIDFPEPTFVDTNGITLAVHEAGDGFPVILCHGFPELAYSWRHQLPALADAGFHAIAPDMRGYGQSDRPDAVESYDITHLTGDLVGLLDHYGYDRAVFVGHDWGGLVTWSMPLLHPDRVSGHIGVNTPFMKGTIYWPDDRPPLEAMRQAHGDNYYVSWFQKPGEADATLARDVERTFDMMMSKPQMTMEEFDSLPPEFRNFDFKARFEDDTPRFEAEPLLAPEEKRVFVEAFEQTGFTGGINWYRNFDRNWEILRNAKDTVECPALMIMADKDYVLRPELADGMEKWVPDLETHLVRDCGHWTQQQHPEEVNRVMLDWLRRHFV